MTVPTKDMDKLDSVIPIRAPACLKNALETELTSLDRKRLNAEILELMARHIHYSRFNPLDYLRSD